MPVALLESSSTKCPSLRAGLSFSPPTDPRVEVWGAFFAMGMPCAKIRMLNGSRVPSSASVGGEGARYEEKGRYVSQRQSPS